MKTAADVVAADLEHIAHNLQSEFREMEGGRLLIVGGAGFLGHYLVQAALHWTRTRAAAPIAVEVWDNYSRGVPPWLTALEGDANLTLRRHDITDPLPADMGDFDWVIHAASIASPTWRKTSSWPVGSASRPYPKGNGPGRNTHSLSSIRLRRSSLVPEPARVFNSRFTMSVMRRPVIFTVACSPAASRSSRVNDHALCAFPAPRKGVAGS